MVKLIEKISNRTISISDVMYDKKFGIPSTEVWNIVDLLDFIDEVIDFSNKDYSAITEELNSKYNLKVKTVVATTPFENALKILCKKHQTKIIEELKNIIIDLGNYKIEKQKSNHPLKGNLRGYKDIHIDGGNLILIYEYVSENILKVGFSESTMQEILKLQDLVNHKQLKRYSKKSLSADTHEFDIDSLNHDAK